MLSGCPMCHRRAVPCNIAYKRRQGLDGLTIYICTSCAIDALIRRPETVSIEEKPE